MNWMKSVNWLAALMLVLGSSACRVDVGDDDDDDDDDNDASDDDAADDDMADDDTVGDDDTFGDDDTGGDDDSIFVLLQQGAAEFTPSGNWDFWTGEEYYTEAIGPTYTCYKLYGTDGVRYDDCPQCDFSFDVSYTLLQDDSDPALCYGIYDPGDGALLGMGFTYYYYYPGYGDIGSMYYDIGYGWYFWGIGIQNADLLDYYYYYYYLY